MARPSLKEERRAQILEAFELCVARHGVEGATLERVAEQAGLTRSLIRHNVGNRDDLLEALVERFLASTETQLEELAKALPAERRLETLIDWLFDPTQTDGHEVLVSEALIAAAANDPGLAGELRGWLASVVDAFGEILAQDRPEADGESIEAVATGLTALYFNSESTAALGPMPELRQASRNAARRLIDSL